MLHFRRNKRKLDDDEWLDALEKGELDDTGDIKKEKDASLMTARQVIMVAVYMRWKWSSGEVKFDTTVENATVVLLRIKFHLRWHKESAILYWGLSIICAYQKLHFTSGWTGTGKSRTGLKFHFFFHSCNSLIDSRVRNLQIVYKNSDN